MVRSAEDWSEILSGLSAKEAVRRILGDLTHYYHGRSYEDEDRQQLANALKGFVESER